METRIKFDSVVVTQDGITDLFVADGDYLYLHEWYEDIDGVGDEILVLNRINLGSL